MTEQTRENDHNSHEGGQVATLPYLPWLERIRPYVPGKPPESVLREIGPIALARLASNENPLGPSSRALEAAREALSEACRYPDDQAQGLRDALSAHHGVPASQIVVGNGSNDLIELCVRLSSCQGRRVVMAEASFPTCRLAALGAGAEVHLVPQRDWRHDLEAMAGAIDARTWLVYVCNPNNPTGTMVTAREVDAFLARVPPRVLVVFDEAYFEYVEDPEFPDLLPRVLRQENVVLLRTFSKCYALALLRVGYALCSEETARQLEKIRLPFNANGVAQRAAMASLGDPDQITRSRAFNAEGKAWLRRELARLGIEARDTSTNFLFLRIPSEGGLNATFLRSGILVRPLEAFGLPPHHYRVTVGTPEENRRFIACLEALPRGG